VEARAASRGLPRPDDLLGPRAQKLDGLGQALRAGLKGLADRAAVRFGRVSGRLRAEALTRDLTLKRRRGAELLERAATALTRGAKRQADGVARLGERLSRCSPARAIARADDRLGDAVRRLAAVEARKLAHDGRRLASAAAHLEAVNPKAILGRGYALVRQPDGRLARRAADLAAGDAVKLEFADGARRAVVEGGAAASEETGRAKPQRKPKTGSGGGQGALF
jgi:exodeoxyribonuclease VII large subunit